MQDLPVHVLAVVAFFLGLNLWHGVLTKSSVLIFGVNCADGTAWNAQSTVLNVRVSFDYYCRFLQLYRLLLRRRQRELGIFCCRAEIMTFLARAERW